MKYVRKFILTEEETIALTITRDLFETISDTPALNCLIDDLLEDNEYAETVATLLNDFLKIAEKEIETEEV